MSDLNKGLSNIQEKTEKVRNDLRDLLGTYEELYHESNGIFLSEKMGSGSEGLDDFYSLIQTLKRNRDVIGSMTRGITNIRPMNKFRFIEEEAPRPEKVEKKKAAKKVLDPKRGLLNRKTEQPEVING